MTTADEPRREQGRLVRTPQGVVRVKDVDAPRGPGSSSESDSAAAARAGSGSRPPISGSTRPATGPATSRQARRRSTASLVHVEPWSAMKVSFIFSLSAAIVILIVVVLTWVLFSAAGVLGAVERAVNDVVGGTFDLSHYLSFGTVLAAALVIAAVEVVLTTAIGTLIAYLYNVTAGVTGGLEVIVDEEG